MSNGSPFEPIPDKDVARMRHDLRAPLNHILGYSEILLEDLDGNLRDSMIGDLNKIQTGGRQLLDLITEHLGQNATVTSQSLSDMYSACRVPINNIMGYTEILKEQAVETDETDWEADILKIAKAAQTWFELASRFLVPRSQINSTKRFRSSAQAAEATSTPADTVFIAKAIDSENSLHGRLLVVDDDANSRELLARRLTRHGHTVITASSGEEALDRLEKETVDLLLLDVMMPGLNGDKVLERVKKNPVMKDLPVIMISASDKLDAVIRCISLGAEDYLPKPCDPVLLQVRIQTVLDKKRLRDKEQVMLHELKTAQEKTDALLLNILPAPIADRLKNHESPIVDTPSEVTVLFADVAGFSSMFQELSALEIVSMLDRVFSDFDQLAQEQDLEKIKTIGDAYMAVGGIPHHREDHAEAVADFALNLVTHFNEIMEKEDRPLQLRIGIDTGPVIAGVIGQNKFSYDLWGDTVNTASRMESLGEPGRIQVSERTYERLKDDYECEERGDIKVKGKGKMNTWWLLARKS